MTDEAITARVEEMRASGMSDEQIFEALTDEHRGGSVHVESCDVTVTERGGLEDFFGAAAGALGKLGEGSHGGVGGGGGVGGLHGGKVDALLGKLGADKVVDGIKEALCVGLDMAVEICSKKDGFFRNQRIKIPMPGALSLIQAKARECGLGQVCDDFEESLNRAAESAAPKSIPVVKGAIHEMTVTDVAEVWSGADDSATEFMKSTCSNPLKEAMREICDESLNQHQVTHNYDKMIIVVKGLPVVGAFAEKYDIHDYALQKCLDGLFVLIADEEKKIRKDPLHRTSELLQGVFGMRDRDLNLIGPDAQAPPAADAQTRPCVSGCGHVAHKNFPTCCTRCRGPSGPHAHDCKLPTAGYADPPTAATAPHAAMAPRCSHGCGRSPFGKFPTCCTHCKGCNGPHAHDCDARAGS